MGQLGLEFEVPDAGAVCGGSLGRQAHIGERARWLAPASVSVGGQLFRDPLESGPRDGGERGRP